MARRVHRGEKHDWKNDQSGDARSDAAGDSAGRRDDWSAVGTILGKTGTEMPNGVYRVGLPRTDSLDGVAIKSGLALGGWLAFRSHGGMAMVMGDLVLTANEVNPVIKTRPERHRDHRRGSGSVDVFQSDGGGYRPDAHVGTMSVARSMPAGMRVRRTRDAG
jgi:hypothetical protein